MGASLFLGFLISIQLFDLIVSTRLLPKTLQVPSFVLNVFCVSLCVCRNYSKVKVSEESSRRSKPMSETSGSLPAIGK